jgi:uncharacterized protein (DUF1330 family)
MSYYFVASIRLNNESEYQKYIEKVDEVFKKFNGEYMAIDNSPLVLEGKWEYSRAVIIRFENEEDFRKWYYSEEYQSILKHRLSGAQCDTILVKGKSK